MKKKAQKNNINSKQGISLILLMLMIVIMIIISAAVIFTSVKNNPTGNAKNATYAHDRTEVQSAISVVLGKIMTDKNGEVTVSPQGDISSGIEYCVTNSKEGATYGKIGWKTPVTNAPSGYDTSYVVGMELPLKEESKVLWKMGWEGNIILRVGDTVYDKNNAEGRGLKALVVTNFISSPKGAVNTDTGDLVEVLKKNYESVEFAFKTNYKTIMQNNYDLVVARGASWQLPCEGLVNLLYDAGVNVYTCSNDSGTGIKIVKTQFPKTDFGYTAGKKVQNEITKNLPDELLEIPDSMSVAIQTVDNAIPLYTVIENGEEYVAAAYMQNSAGGKWLHMNLRNPESNKVFLDNIGEVLKNLDFLDIK